MMQDPRDEVKHLWHEAQVASGHGPREPHGKPCVMYKWQKNQSEIGM